MKVALTAWEDRISPVFDSARTLLIAEIKNGEIVDRQLEPFAPDMISRMPGRINALGIDVMICGAISQLPARIVEACGVRLIPFVSGQVEEVLASYANGAQIVPAFSMPGCGRRHGQERGRKGYLNSQKEVRVMPKKDKTGPQGDGAGTGRGSGGCKPDQGGRGSGQGRGRGGRQGQGQGQGQGRGNRK